MNILTNGGKLFLEANLLKQLPWKICKYYPVRYNVYVTMILHTGNMLSLKKNHLSLIANKSSEYLITSNLRVLPSNSNVPEIPL